MTTARIKSVVTGGCGFIGSHTVDRLLAEGHTVVVIDDLSTGQIENLAQHEGHPGLRIVTADVSDTGRAEPEFAGATYVFHFAARADIVPSIEDPTAYVRANVMGTLGALEAARTANVSKFVYAASSSCYGIPDAYPTSEDAPIRLEHPYALSKYMGEQLVLHWGKVYGLPVVSLRYFNVFGPRSRTTGAYGAVFGIFLAQKLHGHPFTVVGDGRQVRDFVYATDVAQANLLAARSECVNEVFNVGTGEPKSINRLVELLGGDAVHIPKRPGEPDRTHADISKIRRALGWHPTIPFERGVELMLAQIERWRDAPLWDTASIERATRTWFRYLG